ncbi:translation initiation factor eIF4G [Schizosaccharomyces pombe]|uniref:Eukaryotic translation initiation factor 4 gamma n=1 Tax=Schizosaccharomyces pombe (strain 972 / ATCC 24843) TaxID=284812 RepID=IF4G_SCHPO|nr:translation initiation factor eIF4G [Schizosaccharomyces pombe]Q10475.1 RecName: Full=Eukaryotic translation initiation factor 4 gamma; Short=eIF-4-gamma; Short=eIF-4G [Schizosaccharomyces pombe 972h-]CAA97349.1 translation initiation factor eIF4G [Schizosaccharomyces pombe]|eukprot:NP_594602.1 translation initiation factor eIF4G [Schizosaccharomyces pombe]
MSSKPPSNTPKFSYARALASSQSNKSNSTKASENNTATAEKQAVKPSGVEPTNTSRANAQKKTESTGKITSEADTEKYNSSKSPVNKEGSVEKKSSEKSSTNNKPWRGDNTSKPSANSSAERTSSQHQKPETSSQIGKDNAAPVENVNEKSTSQETAPPVSTVPIQFGSITRNAAIPSKPKVSGNMQNKSGVSSYSSKSQSVNSSVTSNPPHTEEPVAAKPEASSTATKGPRPTTSASNTNTSPANGAPTNKPSTDINTTDPATQTTQVSASNSPALSGSSTPSNTSSRSNRQNHGNFSEKRHYDRYGNSHPSYNKYSHYQHGFNYNNSGNNRNESGHPRFRNSRRNYNNQGAYPTYMSNGRSANQSPRNNPQNVNNGSTPIQIPVSLQTPYGQVYGQPQYIVDPNMVQYGPILQPGYVPQYYPVYHQTPYTQNFPNMSRSGSQVSDQVVESPNSSTLSPRNGFAPIVKQQKKSSALKIVNPVTHTEVVVPQKNASSPNPSETNSRAETPTAAPPQISEEEASQRKDAIKLAIQQRIQEKAEAEAKRKAEEKARLEAEENAKREAEEQAKREAEEKAKREAEEKAKREAEEKAKREAEENAKREAEEKAKREAEEKAKREAEEKAKREAEEKAKREAEEKAKREAEEKAKREAEEKAKREAEENAKREAEEKAKREAEENAKREAEEKVKRETEENAKRKAEEEGKREADKNPEIKSSAPLASSEANVDTSKQTNATEPEVVDKTKVEKLKASEGKSTSSLSSPSHSTSSKRDLLSGLESLSLKTNPKSEQCLESLLNSQFITDFSALVYPSTIKPPSTEEALKAGKYEYDVPFLLQFQSVYTDKPMKGWDERMKETVASAFSDKSSRGMYSSSRQSSRSGSNTHSHAGPGFGGPSERKGISRLGIDRGFSSSGAGFGSGSNYKSAPSRGVSHHGHGGMSGSHRGSQRGSRRGGGERDKPDPSSLTIPVDQVAPLQLSANRWQPKKLTEKPAETKGEDEEALLPPEVVQRKVKGSLNKMTLEKFDKISDQILEIAMQSRKENDGRTLKQVIQLTFEKATDEPNFSNMYARFARKMMDSIDDSIRDEGVLDKNNQPVRGGLLFRKYLLSRCQEDFERGWKANLPSGKAGEAEIMSDEYYVAAAIKRRGLGLVRFIGELFKLSMLSEKIMHECIKRLLGNVTDPEEEEIESLCRLLMTVGVNIDATEKGHAAMDVYVLRMETITKIPNLPSRIKFMLMDVMDSRKNGWAVKNEVEKGPKTIAEIHEEAERKKALAESQRPSSGRMHGRDMNRGDSRMGGRGSNPPFSSSDWSNNKDGYARLGQGIRGLKSGTQGSHGPTSLSSMLKGGSVSRTPSRQNSALRREQSVRAPPSNVAVTSANSFELLEEHDHDNDGGQKDSNSKTSS